MIKVIILAATFAVAVGWVGASSAIADEGPRVHPAKHVRHVCHGPRCGPYMPCGVRCRPRCPSPYSCYSLYGAYGPYGGAGFWGAYTYAGWR